MRLRNSVSSASGTFTRNGRIASSAMVLLLGEGHANGVEACPRGMLSRVKANVNGEGDAYYPFRPILAGKFASASLFGPLPRLPHRGAGLTRPGVAEST